MRPTQELLNGTQLSVLLQECSTILMGEEDLTHSIMHYFLTFTLIMLVMVGHFFGLPFHTHVTC